MLQNSVLEQFHSTRAAPLKFILSEDSCSVKPFNIEEIEDFVIHELNDLGDIALEMVRTASNCRVFVLKATATTWTNQRAKRRAAARKEKCLEMANTAFAASSIENNNNGNNNGSSGAEVDNGEPHGVKRPHDEDSKDAWIHREEGEDGDEEDAEVKK